MITFIASCAASFLALVDEDWVIPFIASCAGWSLTIAGRRVAGRLVALGMTVLCGASMVYFLMPPVFTFRISRPADLVTLAFYGTLGLVFATSSTSKRKSAGVLEEPVWNTPPLKQHEADIALAVRELMASDLGVRLRAADIAVEVGAVGLPCAQGAAFRILSDIVMAALRDPEVRRISIHGGRRPGVYRLYLSAHRVWPAPLGRVIIIGKRDEDCEPVLFPGWPPYIRASCFDNGYDRIYQISAETDEASSDT